MHDISKNILSGYNVNETPYYKQRRDGFGRKHRDLIRKEVAGSFEMKITSEEEYHRFVIALRDSKREDGTTPLEVYVNNIDDTKHGYFFVTYNVRLDKDLHTGKKFRRFTVSIEEA